MISLSRLEEQKIHNCYIRESTYPDTHLSGVHARSEVQFPSQHGHRGWDLFVAAFGLELLSHSAVDFGHNIHEVFT